MAIPSGIPFGMRGAMRSAIDLVCGMEVDEKTAVHKSVLDGKTYYFCGPGCKRSFDQDPRKYIDQVAPPPMHHSHHS